METKERNRSILFLILAATFILRAWHLNWGLPELYEEAYPFAVAAKMWNWGTPGFDLNPHFFNYPGFTIYLNFALQVIQYAIGHLFGAYPTIESFHHSLAANAPLHIIISRSISVIADVGTIYFTYRIGVKCLNETSALAASSLVAFSPLFTRQAHLISVDNPLAFGITASLYFILAHAQAPTKKSLILSGVAIGVATACKYTGALLIPAAFAIQLIVRYSAPGRQRDIVSRGVRDAAMIACIALLTFMAFNPYILLSPGEFSRDFGFEELHMSSGHLGADPATSTIAFYGRTLLDTAAGWVPTAAVLIGIVSFMNQKKRKLAWLVVFPLTYLAVILSWKMRADRYLLPVAPSLALLAAVGIESIVERLTLSPDPPSRTISILRSKGIASSLLAGLLLVQPCLALYAYHRSLTLPDTRIIAKQWIERNLPAGSVIATAPVGLEFSPSKYIVVSIPFLPVSPERVAPFYDTRWYEDCDIVIGSDFDYGRYLQDSVQYKEFLSYYRDLRQRWSVRFEVMPATGQPGPAIWLFTAPDSLKKSRFDEDIFHRFDVAPESARVSGFMKQLVTALAQKRRFGKVVQLATEVASVERFNPEAHKVLAGALVQTGNDSGALKEIAVSLSLNGQQPDLIALEASIYLRRGNDTQAESLLLSALTQDRTLELAYDDLLMIYVKRQDKVRALDVLARHYALLDPASEKARLIATDIQHLKSLK